MKKQNNTTTLLLNEQRSLEELSVEVEKVLLFYQEHPEYPLDFEKIMKRVHELTVRIAKFRDHLQQL